MYSEKAAEILKGAYDLHVHTAPSFFPRCVDTVELAGNLVKAGMAGAVIKAHQGFSTSQAYFATKAVEGKTNIYGSVVLNTFVGGINPAAVEAAVKLDAKIVHMPTITSANHLAMMGDGFKKMPSKKLPKTPVKPLTVLDDSGELIPEIYEIFDIVKDFNVLLATGHLSNREGVLLCEKAKEYGVEKVVFTHPDFATNLLDIDTQEKLVRKGVFMERTYIDFEVKPAVEKIRRLGAENYLLTTDFGQTYNVEPAEGMGRMVDELLENGITEAEIRKMIVDNAKYILNV